MDQSPKRATFISPLSEFPDNISGDKAYVPLKRSDFDINIVNNWTEVKTNNPPKRRCQHAGFIYNDYFYVYGGMDINEGRMVDMHRLHMENLSWEEVKTIGVKPEALTNQTYIFINKKLYMLGGENSKEMSTNNLYILNLETLKWEKRIYLNLYFPEISGHSCIYYKNSLIVFGGFAKGMYLNSVYNLNLDINDWTKEEYNLGSVDLNLPEGRMCHSAIIAKDDMFIYAGFNVEKYFGDLWKFNLLSKEWNLIVPNDSEMPEPRIGNSFVYNENDNIIYIFGGKVANIQERNEFWKYDITNNLYELIHDTLLNQTNDIDNISNMPIKKAMSITKQTFNKTTKFDDNKFSIEAIEKFAKSSMSTINNKNLTDAKINRSKKKFVKKNYDEILPDSPCSKKMKFSLIFKMDADETKSFKNKVGTITKKDTKDKLITRSVPAPRDGHTGLIYKNDLLIFGGDRNKFPFNDLFLFKINYHK